MVDVVIPVAGPASGALNPQMPTLIPNFDKPVSGLSGGGSLTPAAFLAANPRVDATMTVTVGGTITNGDIVTLVVTNPIFKDPQFGSQPGGMLSKSVTVVTADTVGTVADKLAVAFNDDPNASAAGLRADVGGASGAVITFRQSGPVGNFSVMTTPNVEGIAGGANVTIGGTALTGDSVYVNFSGASISAVTPAINDVILTGTPATGDTIPLVFTNTSVATFPVTKTYTVQALDTLANIATGVVALINADATLSAAGVEAVVVGNGFTVSHQGAIGNSTVLSCTPGHTGGGSEAIAFTPSNGHLAGGSGQIGVGGGSGIIVSQAVTTGQSTATIATNLKNAINANADLVALGITATNLVASQVVILVPAAAEPATISSWVNTAAPIITITGSATAGDTINAIFTGANLPGSPITATYTVKTADSVTAMALGLSAAINAIPALSIWGVLATPTAGVIALAGFGSNNGQLRITTSVTGSATETLTPSAVPTDTAVLSDTATETITMAPTTGIMSGGTGPVFAAGNFTYARGGQVQDFLYGQPYVLDFPYLTALVNDGRLVV